MSSESNGRGRASPRGRLYGCPVEYTLDLIGGKWSTVVLARLKGERLRYGELRRAIPDLADKVLTQRLHGLEDAGLLTRDECDGIITYALSPLGESLSPALEQLYAWGERRGAEDGVRFRPNVRRSEDGATGQLDEPHRRLQA